MIVVITGVPGTGKTSVANTLGKILRLPVFDDKIVGLGSVDLRKLRMKALHIIRKYENVVFEGHLYCEVQLPADAVIVLRTDPRVLWKRLEKRGWPRKKIAENVLAEALDYCLIKAEEKYEKVSQLDTTRRSAEETAELVRKIVQGKHIFEDVDWSEALIELIQKGFISQHS